MSAPHKPVAPAREFNETLQTCIAFLSRKIKNPSISSTRSLVNSAVTLHPFKLIEMAIPHMISHSKQILERNAAFFQKKADAAIKSKALGPEMSQFLASIGEAYPNLNKKDREFIWANAKNLLYLCTKYQIEINNSKKNRQT